MIDGSKVKLGLSWSVKTWHRRLNQWTYGEEMFYDRSIQYSYHDSVGKFHPYETVKIAKRVNLCPYARRLVVAAVALPFLFVFRQLDKKVWAQVTFIAACLNLIGAEIMSLVSGLTYLGALEITLAATGFVGLIFGIVAGGYVLKEKLHERAARKECDARKKGTYKYPEPKGPNPFKAFIHAKHEKICPEITWVEEKPAEQTPTTSSSTEATPNGAA